ncbi:hypothetical protein [Ferdinandcohnia sp. Marseille-Q9671]
MVTAIVIPVIILYFYFLSRKERKKYEDKWNALENVKEEAVIHGRIINKNEEKQRFYYHKVIVVTELTLKTSSGLIKARRILPLKDDASPLELNIGDDITCIGEWTKDCFRFINHKISNKN